MEYIHLPEDLTYLKVVPSFACAKGCFYCYNTLLDQQTTPDPPRVIEQVRRVLEQTSRSISVELIGGEPLEPPALDTTLELLQMLRAHDRVDKIYLSTALASRRVLTLIAPSVDVVYLSIDMAHDRRNRKLLSDVRLGGITDVLCKTATELRVSCVLYGRESPEELLEFVDGLEKAGITSVGFGHITATRLSADRIETYAKLYHSLFKLRLTRAPRAKIVGTVLDSLEYFVRGDERVSACECSRNSLTIEPDGAVVSGVCVDHRLDPLPGEAFSDERAERLRATTCATCDLWSVCRGGCATEAARFAGDSLARAPFHCAILRGSRDQVVRDMASLS